MFPDTSVAGFRRLALKLSWRIVNASGLFDKFCDVVAGRREPIAARFLCQRADRPVDYVERLVEQSTRAFADVKPVVSAPGEPSRAPLFRVRIPLARPEGSPKAPCS